MVRLKQRYILFEILYPPSKLTTNSELFEVAAFSQSSQNALLTLHQSSPASINPKSITNTLRRSIQDHFGEFGAGTCGTQLSVKYFSNKTSIGIIRCGRSGAQTVVAALALIDRIENVRLTIHCTRVSGTIKKCEEYAIARSRNLMATMTKQGIDRNLTRFDERVPESAGSYEPILTESFELDSLS